MLYQTSSWKEPLKQIEYTKNFSLLHKIQLHINNLYNRAEKRSSLWMLQTKKTN